MPVYLLDEKLIFPHPSLASDDGLLAIGGDLSVDRLVLAYSNGIFPWYSEGSDIMWWSPDPRMILIPSEYKQPKSLKALIKQNVFEIGVDTDFDAVIRHCAAVKRKEQDGTWIVEEMIEAYMELHRKGYAHSIETYSDGKLVGGLYGIALGRAFFGESMFFLEREASKFAFHHLVTMAIEWGLLFIDAQQETDHLKSLGAKTIPRDDFLVLLEQALEI